MQPEEEPRTASSAVRSTILIGVTWLTSTTPVAGWASSISSSAAATRRPTSAKLSPPGGATSSSVSHRSCSSGSASFASLNVSPSQSPKSVSISPSCRCIGTPSAVATGSAVCRVRRSGELTTAVIRPAPAIAASAAAAAVAWAAPRSVSSGSLRPE